MRCRLRRQCAASRSSLANGRENQLDDATEDMFSRRRARHVPL
jgi:hypothetical protein